MEMTTSLKQEDRMVAMKQMLEFTYKLNKGKKSGSTASAFLADVYPT